MTVCKSAARLQSHWTYPDTPARKAETVRRPLRCLRKALSAWPPRMRTAYEVPTQFVRLSRPPFAKVLDSSPESTYNESTTKQNKYLKGYVHACILALVRVLYKQNFTQSSTFVVMHKTGVGFCPLYTKISNPFAMIEESSLGKCALKLRSARG